MSIFGRLLFILLLLSFAIPTYAQRAVIVVIQLADCSTQTQRGLMCYDTDDNVLYIGNGATTDAIGPGTPGAGDIERVGNCVSGQCFVPGGTGTTLESITDLIFNIDADNNGLESFQITDGLDAIAVEVLESGLITTRVGLDAIGAVDMDYGSADVTDHTFITDGTGTAEVVLPAGSIDSTEVLDATLTADDLATSAVETTEILDATIAQIDVNDTQTIAADPANGDSSVWFGTTGLIWEGASSDANEMLLTSADVGQDSTITIPDPGDSADTVVLNDTAATLTNKTIDATNTVTINASDITDLSANTDITADLEEEGQITATVVTGNASSSAVLLGTGASAASWDTTPAIDCTDCTNIPAAADLNDVGNVTLTTPGDGAVLCFTGTASNSLDCTVGGILTATEDSGTITYAMAAGSIIEPDLDADNAATDGDILTYDSTGTNFAWITQDAGTDITADLEEEGAINATAVTGNAASSAVLFGTGSSTAGWDTTPAIDCADCTGIVTGGIADGTITEPDLDADNSPSDNDILTYDSTGTNFAWITQNAGTDITADLEEEAHCAEHDSADVDCSGETIVFAADSLDFTEVVQSNTLAGDPTLLVDECYFIATASGGGFICEGSTDDTNEQLYLFPDLNGADTTDTITTLAATQTLVAKTLTSPAITTPTITDVVTHATGTIDDDDCTGQQGQWWWDVTDTQFEYCNANSGAPDTLAAAAGDITAVGDCSTGSCFTTGNTGTKLESDTDFIIELDADGGGTNTFQIMDDASAIQFEVSEVGAVILNDGTDASVTITGDNSGAVDPVITFSDGVVNISTGDLQEGGAQVVKIATDDITSANLITALSDETGSGAAVFDTSPTIATPNLTGKIDYNNASVSDDDCAADQGRMWYDDTDGRFEFCNANSGTPAELGGDITQVGTDCTSGACFVTGGTGTILESDTGLIMALDANNNGTETFTITDGADATVFTVTEAGAVTAISTVTATSFISDASATPTITFKDSDMLGSPDNNIQIVGNCPFGSTAGGDEDCDLDFIVQGAGAATTIMKIATTDGGATTLQIGTVGTNYINVSEAGVMTSQGTGSINISDANDILALETISLTGMENAQILVGDGAASATYVTVGGDVTIDNAGSVTIAATAVEESMLAASLSRDDGDLLSFASVSVTSATEGLILPQHATDCSTSGTAEGQVCWEADANVLYIGDGSTVVSVGGAEVNNLEAAVPSTILDTEIFIGTGAGTGAFAALSGDVTMSNGGAVTIAAGAVEENMLAATLTFDDGDLLDFGTNVSSATEGILLPANATDCSSATAEAQICWDEDSDALYIGSGSASINIGGTTAFDDIGDPDGDGTVLMAEFDQDLSWNTAAAAAVFDGLTLNLTYDGTSDSGEQNLLRVVQLDGGGDATGSPDALILIENLDTTADDGVAAGLEVRATTSGAMPVAIDVTDAEITTALSAGANDIAATNWSITGSSGAATFDNLTIGAGDAATQTITADLSTTDVLLSFSSDLLVVDAPITADGLNLGLNENVTLGAETLDHDGTDFVFSDTVTINGNQAIHTGSAITASIAFTAAGLSADGTQCADATEVTLGSWGKMPSIICTDNDASTMTATIPAMGDGWDAGTVTVELIYIQDAVDTLVLNADVAGRCTGDTETPAAYGTEVALDDAAVTGTDAKDSVTSGAVTLAGTCTAGDMVQLQVQIDATGTTTAMATLNIVGLKVEYGWNMSGD